MKKKVVLITGVSSGFGFETAKLLSSKFKVYGTVRQQTSQTSIKDIAYVYCDVTDSTAIRNVIKEIENKEGRLDYLINNAGYAVGGFFEDVTSEEFKTQLDVNFFGITEVTRAALPILRQTKGNKKIIMISSIAGLTATPSMSAYNASKWAVEGFSEALYLELKPFDIDVVLIEPGTFKTDIFTRNLKFGTYMNDINSPYYQFSQHIKHLFDKRMADLKSHPKEIANLIGEILENPHPKFRYLIGKDAKIRYWVRRLLPFSWYSGLVKKALKMEKFVK